MEAVCLPSRSSREQSEGWRPGLDLNQDKEHCTALASTLPPPGRPHISRSAPAGPLVVAVNPTETSGHGFSQTVHASDGRATNVMRQGLWPILTATREAVKPLVPSLATISP